MRLIIPADGRCTKRMPWLFRVTYYAFLLVGTASLGYAAYAVVDMYAYQALETAHFEGVTAAAAAAPERPELVVTRAVSYDGVIGEIEAPRVGLKAIVVQGDSAKILRRAVGHLPDTALPGEVGNVALAGHRDGLFRPLRNILPGDVITLRTPEERFQYEVEWTAVVPPTAVRVIQPTSERALTLVTCFPFYYVGSAPERFVVRARELGH